MPEDWTKIETYIAPMPLVKRVQIPRTANDLARELFLYTQDQLRKKRP